MWALGCGSSSQPAPPQEKAFLCSACLDNQMGCALLSDGTAMCEACAVGEYASNNGPCTALSGTPLSHTFPENSTPAGGELLGMCRSWTLGNAAPLYVNAVELQQDEASHHSNWTFVPDSEFDGPDGLWPCSTRDYSQLRATIAGGVLYAQSTQAAHEVQKFPDGVAVVIPANARIIGDVHTLNTTDAAVTGNVTLTLYTIEPAEVTVELVPFHLTYGGLDIPPQSDSRFTGECEVAPIFESVGADFGIDVYYLLPHTHALGTRMFVETLGDEGRTLIDVRGFNGEARGRRYDPPISMVGTSGMRFGCEFHNPRTESVGWGFDDQEMCEVLGFADAAFAFESRVGLAYDDGNEGGVQRFTGPCISLPFELE